jgi:transposase
MDTSQMAPSKRRYRTNAEKLQIVQESMADGVSIAAVARRHGVNANLLFNWRRRYQQGILEKSREPVATKLLPVEIAPEPDRPPTTAHKQPTGLIRITLPGGVAVDVHGRVDGAMLADVLNVLRAR